MKKQIKNIAIFLVAAFMINLIPAQVYGLQNPASTPPVTDSVKSQGKIVGELPEKRGEYVKQFLKDDGTYEADIYPVPVNYLDNGQWKPIDNTLVDQKDENNNDILENQKNDFKVKFAKNTTSSKLVRIQKGNYELSWSIEGLLSSNAEKLQPDLNAYNSLSDDDKKRTVIKNRSGVKFGNILPNTDLNYMLNGNTVKENIVLNQMPENPVYTFNLSTKNLTPVLQKDNSIIFYDGVDTNKSVFQIPAPIMYDTKHAESTDLTITLDETGSGYRMTLKPNQEWLNSPERVFPVVIDPVVSTSLASSNIHDAWVSSGLPDENRDSSVLLGVGYGSVSKITRTFVKFDLPALTSADLVTDARLYLSLYTDQPNVRQINVHRVNGNWDANTITWNNAPSFNSKVEDYAMVNGVACDSFDWDVTGIVKDWYTTGNNYGLMLKNQDETTGYDEFFSANTSGTYESLRAQVVISYVNNTGLENYWTYHSQDVGRAGTGYVNDYNGNLIFMHNDLAMNGNRMPLNLNHVYNSNDKDTDMQLGKGWRLNLNQRIVEQTIDNVLYYIYTDEDGTKHYYKYESSRNAIVDELNPTDTTLTKNADGTYVIKDKKNNQLIFTSAGYLLKIIDSNNNTMSLSYQGANLKSITDGAGRVTTFDLTDPGGYLVKIHDPSGRITNFSYTGTLLTTITYPDGTTTNYTYDADNNLTSASYNNGYKITYSYYTAAPYRVKKVLETHADGTLGNELNLDYGYNTTFFTDVKGRKTTYQFNDFGNTIDVKDADGNAEYYKYLSGTDINNKLSSTSKLQRSVINLLKNHNIEASGDWTAGYWTGSTGTANFTTEAKYLGNQSLKVTKTNTTARQFYSQTLSLTKGKTYTLSGYIKTDNISSTNNKGAALFVDYQDSTGNWQTVDAPYINGTTGFNRQEVTFTLPADAYSNTVYVRAGIIEETGTAYFDALQLEEGILANRYNLVENASFEFNSGTPLFWSKNSACDTGDTTVNTEQSQGTQSFKLNGVADQSKALIQNINVSGQAGDVLVAGGWAKGSSVSLTNGSGRYFALDIAIRNTDGTTKWNVIPFNEDSNDWQYVAGKIIADKPYSSVSYYLIYFNQANTAYFDGLQLYQDEFDQTYTYDNNGNVISAVDLAQNQAQYEFNNNDLTKAIDAKGKQFNYTYDGNHNVTTATSAENVLYSFSYDGNGNPLTAKVGDSSLFINSAATYTTDGNYLDTLTDSQGNSVKYHYDPTKGTLDSVDDAKGHTTSYTYDSNTDQLTSVSKSIGNQTVANNYTYEDNRIKTISSNNDQVNYSFNYDSMGNVTEVKVGTQKLITNTYELYDQNRHTGNLLESTYGNGQKTGFTYDNLDRVTSRTVDGNTKFTYQYDGNGNLGSKDDLVNGVKYRYTYDLANRLVKAADDQGNSTGYSYDINNNLTKVTEKYSDMTAPDGASNLTGRYTVPDSTLVSINKPATASSVEADSSSVTADKAVDGNTSTRWSSKYSDPQWIYVDLGQEMPIKKVVLNWEAAYAKSYSIQVSNDAVNWTTVYSTTTGDGGIDEIDNLNASGRYVRMYGTQRATNYGYSLWEFSIYKANFVSSSNEASTVTADKAFDNNYDTRWSSLYNDNEWIYVDLGSPKTIKHISLDWEAAYGKSYDIQTSDDAVNWTTIYSTTTGDGGTDDIPGLNVSARYVRMYGIQRGTNYGYSLYEFNVYGSDSIITQYGYDADNRSTETILNNQRSITNSYDALGRIDQTTVDTTTPYTANYSYFAGSASNSTTTKVKKLSDNTNNSFDYEYDANGNITKITQNGGTIQYTYNELNELIREDNQVLNKTLTYSYDQGGNILTKTEYPYTTSTLGTPTKTFNYAYGDTNWKDKLTSYDGKAITYDEIGNPLSYDGWNFSWEAGRQLASMSNGTDSLSFKYDDAGIRTEKTVNGVTTKYYLNGDKVVLEDNGTDKIHYSYDATGNLISMNLNGTDYYYIRNAQGDIIGLLDGTGTQVVSYSYDSWGKLIATTGTLASTVGAKNPYLYRGYRYDSETGLYYLQSRYYNPDWGRFINADAIVGTPGELLTSNMFAYSKNNPVTYSDPNGYGILDFAFLAVDVAVFLSEPSLGNVGWVLLDVVCLADPTDISDTAAHVAKTAHFMEEAVHETEEVSHAEEIVSKVSEIGSKSKTGPKPFGTGAHNIKIAEVANSVTDGEIIAGGQKYRERAIPTPEGIKSSRRPDILVKRVDGTIYGINVGKVNKFGAPIKREAEAINDLEGANIPMYFVSYK